MIGRSSGIFTWFHTKTEPLKEESSLKIAPFFTKNPVK